MSVESVSKERALAMIHRERERKLAQTEARRQRQRRQLETAVAPLRESYAYLLEHRAELRDLALDIEERVHGGASPHWFAFRALLGLDTEYLP